MHFTVCLAAWRAATIGAAIRSVLWQTHQDWELIIACQGHDEALREVCLPFAQRDARVHYLHLPQPGTSRARNAAIAAGSGDAFAIIDDDCEAREDWLDTLERCFRDHPAVGLVTGAVVAPDPERSGISSCPEVIPADTIYDPVRMGRRPPEGWDWIGCNVAISRPTVDAVGLLDGFLGPGTAFPCAEDTDYKFRLEARGIIMRSTPDAVVYHTHGRRYGMRAMLRQSYTRATGNGGLAGKLAMGGDPRGAGWLRKTATECLREAVNMTHPARSAISLRRWYYFLRAYRRCQREYWVDETQSILRRRDLANGS